MTHPKTAATLALAATLLLAACGPGQVLDDTTELGAAPAGTGFGEATAANHGYHTGQISYAQALADRFVREVPDTITFAFDSATLDESARATLDRQAAFIRAFPEVRFSVYGHTDLVGSAAYNQNLGLRRARAAVDYLVSRGADRARLEALVSLGETRPVVPTETREPRNRRTVTTVSGFVQGHPMVLDGRYAAIVYRSYAAGPSTTGD